MTDLMTIHNLFNMWPHGNQHVPMLMEGIASSAPAVFEKYGISNKLVVAHMMGQFSEECGGGLEMEESLNYTADRLVKIWPRHFNRWTAVRYAHNPRAIADIAYGGRMGNAPPPSDDGWNFRGRGLSQVTGKTNYAKLAEVTGIDCVADPDLLSHPETCLELAVADYAKICGCIPFAERDDTINETKHLNGGLIGYPVRVWWIAKWRRELQV